MNRFSHDALIRIVFILIGFVVGLLDFLVPRTNVQPDALESRAGISSCCGSGWRTPPYR